MSTAKEAMTEIIARQPDNSSYEEILRKLTFTGMARCALKAPEAKEFATFQAKCAECSKVFDHPCLSDYAYGEFIFCGEDGKTFAYCNSFDPTSRLIDALLPDEFTDEMLQAALANLADRIGIQKLTNKIYCPGCHATNLEYFHGTKTGVMWVKQVTYHDLLSLNRENLKAKISQFVTDFHNGDES